MGKVLFMKVVHISTVVLYMIIPMLTVWYKSLGMSQPASMDQKEL